MNDNTLLFIIMLVLTYLFDHKILPQLGVVALALISMLNIAISGTNQYTYIYMILYVINIVYCAFMITVAPMEKDENEYL